VTFVDFDATVPKIMGVTATVTCASGAIVGSSATIVSGGSTDASGTHDDLATMLGTLDIETSAGNDDYTFVAADFNTVYYQAGFYDTSAPKFFRDALHEGLLHGSDSLNSQKMTIMGGRTGTSYFYYKDGSYVGVDDRQMFGDFHSLGTQGAGTGRMAAANRPTSSIVVGSQGDGHAAAVAAAAIVAGTFQEHLPKYAYVGRGFDQLTVTPTPDEILNTASGAADSRRMVVTYRGASGSCSVTEVDRGTHESSVCSGRGNCDTATGTCLCDAGYTLEACSEQTVLV
jgi:hypothetical protein